MRKINVGVIGISGFGSIHINVLRQLENKGLVNLVAVCDSNEEKNKPLLEELAKKNVRYYKDYQIMLKQEKQLDFVSISTPIHLHKKMAVDVMTAGFHVLLEKPPAVTIQDIEEIIETSRKTGKLCGVDFQNASMRSFRLLLEKVQSGELGKITSISGMGLWKRTTDYYQRTPWAGKIRIEGNYVLDGTVNNPLAHLINNMLLIVAAQDQEKAGVKAVTAELYHAHDIESEDTSCIKVQMNSDIVLYYYATLCHREQETPFIIVEGEKGKAFWNYKNCLEITMQTKTDKFEFEAEDNVGNMFLNMCEVIGGRQSKLYCSAEDTRNFVLASNGAFISSAGTHKIQSEHIKRVAEGETTAVYINDIKTIMNKAMEDKCLLSQTGVAWAVSGTRFDMGGFTRFDLFG